MNKSHVLFLVFVLIISILGPHFGYSVLSIISLSIIFSLFFRKENYLSPIILLGLIFQWVQINVKLWYGNFIDVSLSDQFSFYQNVNKLYDANFLSNLGLISFSIGVYFVLNNAIKKADVNDLILSTVSTKKLLLLYVAFSVFVTATYGVGYYIPGFNTFLTSFQKLKWGVFVVVFVYSMKRNENKRLLTIIVVFEFLLGFTGYFSTFREVIIMTILALLMTLNSFKLSLMKWVQVSLAFIFIGFIGLGWTSVKSEYREYISGGGGQKVSVSKVEALGKAFDLLADLDKSEIRDSFDETFDRLSYIEFFSITLDYVPVNIPHENGRVFLNSISFFFKPRILFPDKEVIDDSKHTNTYTGLSLVGGGKASHSIGYMTDAYIDFGVWGMHIEIFFLACILAFGLKLMFLKSKSPLIAVILMVPFYFFLSPFGFNMIKVFGNFITYFIPVFIMRNKFNQFLLFVVKKQNVKEEVSHIS